MSPDSAILVKSGPIDTVVDRKGAELFHRKPLDNAGLLCFRESTCLRTPRERDIVGKHTNSGVWCLSCDGVLHTRAVDPRVGSDAVHDDYGGLIVYRRSG